MEKKYVIFRNIVIVFFSITVNTLREDVVIPFNNVRKQFRDDYGLRIERQRYDGWYNNMAHPEWGAVGKFANTLIRS